MGDTVYFRDDSGCSRELDGCCAVVYNGKPSFLKDVPVGDRFGWYTSTPNFTRVAVNRHHVTIVVDSPAEPDRVRYEVQTLVSELDHRLRGEVRLGSIEMVRKL